MVRLLNNILDITANKKLNAEERLNSISGLHIQFDKLKKETGLLSGAIQPHLAHEAPLATRPVQPNVLADKGIRSEFEPEREEQDKQYEDVLDEKDKSHQASILSSQMERVIRWNESGLYQQKVHRLIKNITEHPIILMRNENGEGLVYEDAIAGSNYKSLFKSMVSNQQNLNQVGID